MNINDKISSLKPDEILKFDYELLDRLYDRQWCFENRINYVNPNILEAKEALYSESFEVL